FEFTREPGCIGAEGLAIREVNDESYVVAKCITAAHCFLVATQAEEHITARPPRLSSGCHDSYNVSVDDLSLGVFGYVVEVFDCSSGARGHGEASRAHSSIRRCQTLTIVLVLQVPSGVIRSRTSTTNSPLICAAFGPLIFSDQRPSADRRQFKSAVNQRTQIRRADESR